jgi:hypothetical protein
MSLAGNVYRELTGYDDPDSYAPPLHICLGVALVYCLTLVPWKSVLRVLGFTILVYVALVLLAL